MTKTEPIVFCRYSCGNSMHADCFEKWKAHTDKNICVYCRQSMEPTSSKKQKVETDEEEEEYINVSNVVVITKN